MKSYIKIISSIFVASLALATFAAVISGLIMLISGEYDIRGITIPYVFAWFGFLLFGIPGSLVWFISSKAMEFRIKKPHKINIFSVVIAILISIPLLTILESGFDFNKILKSYWLLVLVVPVALASLIAHGYITSREKHNKKVKHAQKSRLDRPNSGRPLT